MRIFTITFLIGISLGLNAQVIPSGLYQGFIKGLGDSQPSILYIQFKAGENYTRIEHKEKEIYNVKRFSVALKENVVILTESTSKSSSNARETPRCKLLMELINDSLTGYLKGNYKSLDCRNEIGEIVLYPANNSWMIDNSNRLSKTWFNYFINEYNLGYPAPHIRKKQMENFKFQPIYFDHDKSEIKESYHAYLKEMVYIVKGHHDLRISVTGHTDAVGTDAYNVRLSERRANSIRNYFVSLGLAPDKLEIDFKGEKNPVADNFTKEGKQKNRRVDFSFI